MKRRDFCAGLGIAAAAGEALGGLDLDAAEGAKLILKHGSN